MAAVAVGGAGGSLLRYAVAEGVRVLTAWPSWVGTFVANALGCLAIGFIWAWAEQHDHEPWVRGLLLTGLLGAFTTFSTFSLEAMQLMQDRAWGTLVAYVGGSLLVGLCAVACGLALHARL